MSVADSVAAEVRGLAELDLEGLRAAWRRRFGCPPGLRSPELLRFMIAWRLQVAAHGDHDADVKRELRKSARRKVQALALNPGTRLRREWRGRLHEVVVTEAGFVWEGVIYSSLSAVAGAITGGKWNGVRFFGLEQT